MERRKKYNLNPVGLFIYVALLRRIRSLSNICIKVLWVFYCFLLCCTVVFLMCSLFFKMHNEYSICIYNIITWHIVSFFFFLFASFVMFTFGACVCFNENGEESYVYYRKYKYCNTKGSSSLFLFLHFFIIT